ncbi:hypothetical protein EYF80_004816 [Liparis tanakae]|uniref:Uncharacterized protein n=1 Tax=Liparis tanakae TaxID=230148 RepID=A0A4Z2J4A0_9TELE|nr:hypothetical protein EYF80_004816 [Liparis tanakae]
MEPTEAFSAQQWNSGMRRGDEEILCEIKDWEQRGSGSASDRKRVDLASIGLQQKRFSEERQYELPVSVGVLFLLRPCFLLRCVFGTSLASDRLWWGLKRLHLQEVTTRIFWTLLVREWAGMQRWSEALPLHHLPRPMELGMRCVGMHWPEHTSSFTGLALRQDPSVM